MTYDAAILKQTCAEASKRLLVTAEALQRVTAPMELPSFSKGNAK